MHQTAFRLHHERMLLLPKERESSTPTVLMERSIETRKIDRPSCLWRPGAAQKRTGRRLLQPTMSLFSWGWTILGLSICCMLLPLFEAPLQCIWYNIEVPRVFNGEPVRDAPIIQVTPENVTLDGLSVWQQGPEAQQPSPIPALVDVLEQKAELWRSFHPERELPGVVLVEADRNTPCALIKSVLWSSATAGFADIDFLAIQLER